LLESARTELPVSCGMMSVHYVCSFFPRKGAKLVALEYSSYPFP